MTESVERRGRTRNDVSCLIHVRRPEITLARFETAFEATNSSPDSLYFVADNLSFPKKMRLLLTFPFNPDPSRMSGGSGAYRFADARKARGGSQTDR